MHVSVTTIYFYFLSQCAKIILNDTPRMNFEADHVNWYVMSLGSRFTSRELIMRSSLQPLFTCDLREKSAPAAAKRLGAGREENLSYFSPLSPAIRQQEIARLSLLLHFSCTLFPPVPRDN